MGLLATQKVIAMVPTKDKDRARKFYESVLGLRFIEDDSFALVFELNGAGLRITKVPEFTVTPYTILGWSVTDIIGAIRELQSAGVEFNKYDYFQQDEHRVWTAPDGTKVAWFKDPDGNTLSLTQHT